VVPAVIVVATGMVAGSTFPKVAIAFEPSTWAEVDDAATSRKAAVAPHDPMVAKIVSFTDCPMRCVDGEIPDLRQRGYGHSQAHKIHRTSVVTTSHQHDSSPHSAKFQPAAVRHLHAPPAARSKRNPMMIGDLLGLGRVDLESQTLVRRYPSDFAIAKPVPPFPVIVDKESSDRVSGVINPSSASFRPIHYLARIHCKTSLADFQSALSNLTAMSDSLNEQASALRATSHSRLALAAKAVEQTRRSALATDSFSELFESMQGENQLAAADVALDEAYRHIVDRQRRIDRLKHVLAVVNRYSWLFELPVSLRDAGKADIRVIEQNALLYGRAREWVKAQEGRSFVSIGNDWIVRELEDGIQEFVKSIEQRLSTFSTTDRPYVTRLVDVVESIGHDNVVESALNTRMSFARDSLGKAGRVGPVSAVLRARVGGGGQTDAFDLISRMSRAFVDGLEQFWDLAHVASTRSKWNDVVSLLLPSFVSEYAEQVRLVLLQDVRMVTREAALDIVRSYSRASKEVRVPPAHLGPLRDVMMEIVDVHVSNLCRSVKASASDLGRTCFENNTVGALLPHLAYSLAEQAVGEVHDLIELGNTGLKSRLENVHGQESESNAVVLGTLCATIPELIADTLRKMILEKIQQGNPLAPGSSAGSRQILMAPSRTSHDSIPFTTGQNAYASCIMGTARYCGSIFENEIVQQICRLASEQLGVRSLEKTQSHVLGRLRTTRQEAIQIYCEHQFPEVRWSAQRIAEMRSCEGLRTSQSMEVDSASPQAVEVLLNICLAVCRAREDGGTRIEIELVQRELLGQIANALNGIMASNDKSLDMAAQIWVDITFIAAVASDQRGSSHTARKAVDGLLNARQAAVDAVKRAGFPFSTAEEENLRRTAVSPSVQRARLMRQTMDGNGPTTAPPNAAWVRDVMTQTLRPSQR
jgi:Exocyst complex component Sec5